MSPPNASSCCLRYLAPPLIDCTGSSTLLTPRPAAVPGMSCVRPRAPAPEPAFGLKPDSCLIRPASSAGSSPLACAAAVISEPYGVPAGSADGPVEAVAVVATGAVGEASDAKFVVELDAFASAVEKLAPDGAAAGAG